MKLVVDRVSDVPQAPEGEDPFAAFTSETAPYPTTSQRPRWSGTGLLTAGQLTRRILIVTAAVAALVALGLLGFRQIQARWLVLPTGVLTVSSNPAGAEVVIDGRRRGVTPLTLNLPVGVHKLTIRRAGASRELNVTTKKNVELVQSVELAAPVPDTGGLSVTSDPAGLKIAIDGIAVGVTPVVLDQLKPGTHMVTLSGKNGTTQRAVAVEAGSTANLAVTMPANPVATVGSIDVVSPIEVQLFEGNELVGSSEAAHLYLPAGSHALTAVNEALAFRRSLSVAVQPGQVTRVNVPIPNGSLSVNAQPWAEVFVDGKSLGETPIGNYSLPIGSHELVLKHPQLGERRQNVVIAVGKAARVGVDLRQ